MATVSKESELWFLSHSQGNAFPVQRMKPKGKGTFLSTKILNDLGFLFFFSAEYETQIFKLPRQVLYHRVLSPA